MGTFQFRLVENRLESIIVTTKSACKFEIKEVRNAVNKTITKERFNTNKMSFTKVFTLIAIFMIIFKHECFKRYD